MSPDPGHAAQHCPLGVAHFDGQLICYSFDDAGACPWPASEEERMAFSLPFGRLVVRELGREVSRLLTPDLLKAIADDLEHQARKGRAGAAVQRAGLAAAS